MALLADHEIEDLVASLEIIRPYTSEQLNPASYDVTLGHTLLLEDPGWWRRWFDDRFDGSLPHSHRFRVIDISNTSEADPFWLRPGEFVLGCTDEVVSLPGNVSAQFVLKSSRARSGLEHSEAGWIDCGFAGRVTLELQNVLRYHPIALWKGQRIGQLKLMRHAPARAPYGTTDASHYQFSWGVRSSWEEPAS